MRESVVFGLSVLGVAVGLAVLIGAEATESGLTVVAIGGVIVLLGVGGMTGLIAALDG